ncbi:hypothetical protein Q8A64_05620 [Oxalobacteraceae bacterium R-40]|uniref:Uncharacterized protein n=1 Tax=Keguizhuia sedimenti TaxID=3064264 RepID=A0ABU1BLX0_9BURK|nr:hypothetical protein [Oxalobacteraceae bacterium R-40]
MHYARFHPRFSTAALACLLFSLSTHTVVAAPEGMAAAESLLAAEE